MKQQNPKHSRLSLARRLRLQQLAVFEKVVEMGSILAASRELSMTQPAVSKSIHELEQQLDGLLFVRGKRGVVLTELGSLFERHTKTMLAELRYLADDLNDWQTGISGHVIVGTLITASATLLPEAITRLRQAVPDVVVTVRVGPNSMLFPALARGELDVVVGVLPDDTSAVLRDDAERARLTHVALYAEALRAVVGSQNALARRRKIRLADLHELEWIVPTQDSVAYPSVRALFEKEGLAMPRRLVESVSILTNLGLVSSGSMVALMPQSAAERFAQAGLLNILPLEGLSPFSDVGYTVRSDRPPSAAAQHFLTALRDAGRELYRTR
ncbi:LysR family transcriptional regulator [Polaromonas sp. P2-4]|nr:LysR family transcriptional regulator [Polaromonas sp. P2-4]